MNFYFMFNDQIDIQWHPKKELKSFFSSLFPDKVYFIGLTFPVWNRSTELPHLLISL
jgi:hypothetical protein